MGGRKTTYHGPKDGPPGPETGKEGGVSPNGKGLEAVNEQRRSKRRSKEPKS